jgi:hypothetical protein
MTIWNILRPFGIIYGLLVNLVVIWYFWSFWNVWTKKNLATLAITHLFVSKNFALCLSFFPAQKNSSGKVARKISCCGKKGSTG